MKECVTSIHPCYWCTSEPFTLGFISGKLQIMPCGQVSTVARLETNMAPNTSERGVEYSMCMKLSVALPGHYSAMYVQNCYSTQLKLENVLCGQWITTTSPVH